jgi:hypothetical protein
LTVQATIKKLATSPAQASNVDWLTEAVQRLSKAYASKQAFSTVSMKQISRMEKVSIRSSLPNIFQLPGPRSQALYLTLTLVYDSGRHSRPVTQTRTGPKKKKPPSNLPSRRTAPSSASCAKRSARENAHKPKSSASTGTGRTGSCGRRTS